jgi:hypothetical protein
VPQDIRISRIETDHGYDYVIDAQDQTWPDGTRQDADLLDTLNLPDNAGFNATKQAVREAGHKMRDSRIRTALKFRKQAANSQEHMRLTAGITTNSQAHKRVGRDENQRDALDGTRQRDAVPQKWDAPDALTKPHVTDPEKRDAVDPQRDAVAASQTGRVPPYKGTRSEATPQTTPTTPLF